MKGGGRVVGGGVDRNVLPTSFTLKLSDFWLEPFYHTAIKFQVHISYQF